MPKDNLEKTTNLKISIVIPVKDEHKTIECLIDTLKKQTFQPDEIIIVDGGSTDGTVSIIRQLILDYPYFRIIEAGESSPGKGRNIGVFEAKNDLIAFTDAGIILDNNWLANLVKVYESDYNLEVIYGNFRPVINNNFDLCSSLTYVAVQKDNGIRTRFIASSLIKKEVWEKTGGFPDMRAAEDLTFMELIEDKNFNIGFAPKAMVEWELSRDLSTTFKRFVLYSKHNAAAGRQWDWHHGIGRQYLGLMPFILLAFLHSWWWFMIIPVWLFIRTARRLFIRRYEYGIIQLFNPVIFFTVAFLIILIDIATFIGWGQAILTSGKISPEKNTKHRS